MRRVKDRAAPLVTAARRVLYAGDRFWCPVCDGTFRRMLPYEATYSLFGVDVDHHTPNALCPACGSDIRHRLAATVIEKRVPAGCTLVHFAPEPHLHRFLERKRIRTIPCDLDADAYPGARRVDIRAMTLESASVDAILSIHVLEHVDDDQRAMSEMFRVLKPGGTVITAVPIYGDVTREGHGMPPDARRRMFGVDDHMRAYGLDLQGRLDAIGFRTELVSIDDIPGRYVDRSARSPHIDSDRYVFVSRRPV